MEEHDRLQKWAQFISNTHHTINQALFALESAKTALWLAAGSGAYIPVSVVGPERETVRLAAAKVQDLSQNFRDVSLV